MCFGLKFRFKPQKLFSSPPSTPLQFSPPSPSIVGASQLRSKPIAPLHCKSSSVGRLGPPHTKRLLPFASPHSRGAQGLPRSTPTATGVPMTSRHPLYDQHRRQPPRYTLTSHLPPRNLPEHPPQAPKARPLRLRLRRGPSIKHLRLNRGSSQSFSVAAPPLQATAAPTPTTDVCARASSPSPPREGLPTSDR